MFAKEDPGSGWGTNEGRIRPMKTTISNALTVDGELILYASEAEFTDDPIEDAFFGTCGVFETENLQDKLWTMQEQGFRHHAIITPGDHVRAVEEALSKYLGYTRIKL